LIAEVRLRNEPVVRAGRESRDIWHQPKGEITKARQSFDERVAPNLVHCDGIFEDELVRTLAEFAHRVRRAWLDGL
jgi:hypothetical protein